MGTGEAQFTPNRLVRYIASVNRPNNFAPMFCIDAFEIHQGLKNISAAQNKFV